MILLQLPRLADISMLTIALSGRFFFFGPITDTLICIYCFQVRRRLRLDGPELEEHRRREKERESETARQKQEQARR